MVSIKIKVPPTVKIDLVFNSINIKGPKGLKRLQKNNKFICNLSNNGSLLICSLTTKDKKAVNSALEKKFLLFITQLRNSIKGVFKGFFAELQLQGVGYRFLSFKDKKLKFKVGFCNDLEYTFSNGIEVYLESPTKISLFSHDYDLLKETASKLKSFKAPDSYKGKGFSYKGEALTLKEIKKG
jgi:large subunit ribosomal protein L6